MSSKRKLDKILSGLYSEKARAELVHELVGKMEISKETIEMAVEYYLKSNMYRSRAAEIAFVAGMTDKAIEIYEESGDIAFLIRLLNKVGLSNRVHDLSQKAIAEAEKKGDFWKVAEIAEAVGDIKTAIDYHIKAGHFSAAAKLATHDWFDGKARVISEMAVAEYEKKGRHLDAAVFAKNLGWKEQEAQLILKAIDDDAEAGDYLSAYRLAIENGLPEKAKEFVEGAIRQYEYTSWIEGAVEIALENGMTERAIELFESKGRMGDAVNIALKAGLIDQALAVYERAGRYDLAAKLAERKGLTSKAEAYRQMAQKSITAKDMAKRMNLSMRAHRPRQEAIQFYEDLGCFKIAADIARQAGLADKARTLYEKAILDNEKIGRYGKAAEDAKKIGLIDHAIVDYMKLGHTGRAAEIALQAKDFNKAIQYFEDAEYFDVALQIAKKAGFRDKTEKLYQKMLQDYEIKGYYEGALRAAQEAGMKKKARVYERIIEMIQTTESMKVPNIGILEATRMEMNRSR